MEPISDVRYGVWAHGAREELSLLVHFEYLYGVVASDPPCLSIWESRTDQVGTQLVNVENVLPCGRCIGSMLFLLLHTIKDVGRCL